MSDPNNKLFVSIAAYRDPDTVNTLKSLFSWAVWPENVFVGLVLQDVIKDTSLSDLEISLRDIEEHIRPQLRKGEQVGQWGSLEAEKAADGAGGYLGILLGGRLRVLFIDWQKARGVCWARSLAACLHGGEQYFLQIDSHMRFKPRWDEFLFKELSAAEQLSESKCKVILTFYPPPFPPQMRATEFPKKDFRLPILCAHRFDDDGLLRTKGRRIASLPTLPLRSLFWAAGFSFSSADMLRDVPPDGAEFIFFGEEQRMWLRLWTSGWTFYCPSEAVAFHKWCRDERSNAFVDRATQSPTDLGEIDAKRAAALECVKETVRCKAAADSIEARRLGLGSVRSAKSFWEFCGIDPDKKLISAHASRGGLPSVSMLEDIEERRDRMDKALCLAASWCRSSSGTT